MLHFVQHDKTDCVIPSQSEESSAMWMLRFAQHDKKEKCASLSMTMLMQDIGIALSSAQEAMHSLSLWPQHGKRLCQESAPRYLIALQCAKVHYTLRCGRCAKDCLF